jgi:hypothetical protein
MLLAVLAALNSFLLGAYKIVPTDLWFMHSEFALYAYSTYNLLCF